MITLAVGAARDRTPDERASEIEYAKALLRDKHFEALIVDTADRLVREWSSAADPVAREGTWFKLQGLQALLKELQCRLDDGLMLSVGDRK